MAMAPANRPLGGLTVGAGGQMLTPQQVAEQRKVAAALMQQAGDTSPVGHWTAALNRGLQGYLGGRDMFKANETESNETARALEAFQNRSGMQQPSPVASALAGGGMAAGSSPDTLGLIREFEGFRETPYWDVNAHRTGYGSDTVTLADGRVVPVDPNTRVTREDAERDLERRVSQEFMPRAASAVGQDVWNTLSEPQRAALTSITYNYGSLPSSVARAVASGDMAAATQAIRALSSHNDGVNESRRNREADIFSSAPAGAGVSAAPAAGNVSEIAALLADPWLPASARGVLEAEMNQQMQMQNASYEAQLQNQDPLRQLQIQQAQLELQAAQNPTVDPWSGVQEVNNQLVRMGPNGPEVVMDLRDPEAPKFQTVTLPDNSQALYQYDNTTGQLVPADVAGGGTLGTGGRAGLTESQAKTTLFSNMQAETNPVLSQIEERYNPANTGDAIARATPIAGNFFQTEEGQIYQAAATAWAEGALRITTGAAATDPEIQRNLRVYFAQPGDTPATVAFKAQMRAMFERSIQASLGRDISGQGALALPEDFAAQAVANAPPEVAAQIMGDVNGPRDYSTMSATQIQEIFPTLQGAEKDAAIQRLRQIAGQQ